MQTIDMAETTMKKICCKIGEFKCDIPMPIAGRVRYVDFCIADLLAALNAANIKTVASCCGHNKQDGSILLEDGRELILKGKYRAVRRC